MKPCFKRYKSRVPGLRNKIQNVTLFWGPFLGALKAVTFHALVRSFASVAVIVNSVQ